MFTISQWRHYMIESKTLISSSDAYFPNLYGCKNFNTLAANINLLHNHIPRYMSHSLKMWNIWKSQMEYAVRNWKAWWHLIYFLYCCIISLSSMCFLHLAAMLLLWSLSEYTGSPDVHSKNFVFHEMKRMKVMCFIYFLIIYLFLERGKGKEKEKEKNINVWLPLTCSLLGTWPATQVSALTGNRTSSPFIRSPCSIHWATPVRVVSFIFEWTLVSLEQLLNMHICHFWSGSYKWSVFY